MTVPKKRAKAAPDELPTLRFRAPITRSTRGSWMWIDVPQRVSRAFAPWAKAGHVRVDATLDGVAVQTSLTPRGGGQHMILLSAALRREAGVAPGKTLAVTVTPRVTDAVLVPDDLAAALAAEGARDAFEAMSSSHRWELVRYVLGARTDATRARYVSRAVDHVLGRAPAEPTPSRRRAPQGWHCPACGRRFARVDAEHACEPLSVDVPFQAKPAAVRAVFDALRARLEAMTHATMAVTRDGVSWIGARRFLSAVPRRQSLEVRFTMARRVEDPAVRAFTMGPTSHINVLRVRSVDELDGLAAVLVREAIAYGAPSVTRSEEVATSSGWARDVGDDFFAGLDDA